MTAPADELGMGVMAAEQILADVYRIDVAKALNPLNRRDFLVIVGRLARQLRVAGGPEATALRKAIDSLDVDWARLTAKGRDKVIEAARRSMADSAKQVVPRVEGVLEEEGPKITRSTRSGMRKRHRLDIAANLSTFDRRVIEFNTSSQANFVTNEIGQRAVEFSKQARGIVSRGLRVGAKRADIASDMRKELLAKGLRKQQSYYEVVSSSFTNRSRTFGQLSSMSDAGIRRYFFEAMLDETTSNTCRFMHGKSFEVSTGIEMFDRVERLERPELIKDALPWVRDVNTPDGPAIQIKSEGQTRTVARVVQSAVGRQDRTGRFSGGLSDTQLTAAGVTVPPLHGLCRSIIVPDI